MRLVILAFYLLGLLGCSEPNPTESAPPLQLHQDQHLRVSLSPAKAPVEQLLTWTVELTAGWQIKQAQVVGLSMSMGVVPLLFQPTSGSQQFQAEMVLGACSQRTMQWQLQLTLLDPSHVEKQLLLPFYSSWPNSAK